MSGLRHIVNEIYSEVLFELAEEAGLLDAVMGDLAEVAKLLKQQPEFISLLNSKKVKDAEKTAILHRVFSSRVDDLTLHFLSVLAKRNRLGFLSGIADRYELLLDYKRNRKLVEVTFATEPTEQQIAKLMADLREAVRAEVKLDIRVDPDILGGIIIRKDGMVIDNSVKTILGKSVDVVVQKSREKQSLPQKKTESQNQ